MEKRKVWVSRFGRCQFCVSAWRIELEEERMDGDMQKKRVVGGVRVFLGLLRLCAVAGWR